MAKLHLTRVAVGCPDYPSLEARIAARAEQGEVRFTTRFKPKRADDLIGGSTLRTVRGLAGHLGIAPNTVAKTYRELEQLGIIETRGRAGTFVADSGDPTRTLAQRAATGYVRELRTLGMSDDEVLEFVVAALRGA